MWLKLVLAAFSVAALVYFGQTQLQAQITQAGEPEMEEDLSPRAIERGILPFWQGDGVEHVEGLKLLQEHPLGKIAFVQVARLPVDPNGPIVPEFVFELDRHGAILNKWPVPVDFSVSGIDGNELLVSFSGWGVWVSTDGSFRIDPNFKSREKPLESVEAKAPIAFGDQRTFKSDYADRTSGNRRSLYFRW